MTALRAPTDGLRGRTASVPLPRQQPLAQWPQEMIDPAFSVEGDLLRLAKKLGFDPETGADNLDDYYAALVRIDLGGRTHQVGLQAYRGSPSKTYNVMLGSISYALVEYLVEWLGITAASLHWASPNTKGKLQRALSRHKMLRRLQIRRSLAN